MWKEKIFNNSGTYTEPTVDEYEEFSTSIIHDFQNNAVLIMLPDIVYGDVTPVNLFYLTAYIRLTNLLLNEKYGCLWGRGFNAESEETRSVLEQCKKINSKYMYYIKYTYPDFYKDIFLEGLENG